MLCAFISNSIFKSHTCLHFPTSLEFRHIDRVLTYLGNPNPNSLISYQIHQTHKRIPEQLSAIKLKELKFDVLYLFKSWIKFSYFTILRIIASYDRIKAINLLIYARVKSNGGSKSRHPVGRKRIKSLLVFTNQQIMFQGIKIKEMFDCASWGFLSYHI